MRYSGSANLDWLHRCSADKAADSNMYALCLLMPYPLRLPTDLWWLSSPPLNHRELITIQCIYSTCILWLLTRLTCRPAGSQQLVSCRLSLKDRKDNMQSSCLLHSLKFSTTRNLILDIQKFL